MPKLVHQALTSALDQSSTSNGMTYRFVPRSQNSHLFATSSPPFLRSHCRKRNLPLHRRVQMPTRSERRIHLILDFDGTIVKNNTLPLLDYLRQDKNAVSYKSFLEPYMVDYNEHTKSYRPVKKDRITLGQELEYLASLSKVERASIERIERSGWLKGVRWRSDDMKVFDDAARLIETESLLYWRPGLIELMSRVWDSDGLIDILSVNWSGNFIRSLISKRLGDRIIGSRLRIYSNEIDPSGTGRLSRVRSMHGTEIEHIWPETNTVNYKQYSGIWTSRDKGDVLRSITTQSRGDGKLSVYIGDSKTDLECMIEADIGIRIQDHEDPSEEQIGLSEVLDRINITKQPLMEWSGGVLNIEKPDQTIWSVGNFSTVHDKLFAP